MYVLVFSDQPGNSLWAQSLHRARGIELEFRPRAALSAFPIEAEGWSPDLLYIDVAGMSAAQRTRSIRRVLSQGAGAVGIIDPQDEIADPASWFREGLADYIGSAAAGLLKERRLKEVLSWYRDLYHRSGANIPTVRTLHAAAIPATIRDATKSHDHGPVVHPDFPQEEIPLPSLIPSPQDWTAVRTGNEYSFALLYVGVDLAGATSSDSRAAMLQDSLKKFRSALSEQVHPYHGRIWFWKDAAGLVLFPFDGESPDALIAAVRVVLRSVFWQAEARTNYLTKQFRLALHIGNTVYRDGVQRETLVSDIVNYMFHLGSKHAAQGSFVTVR